MIKQECNGLHYPVQHACQYSWYQNLFLQAMAIGQISCNDADMLSGNMILRYDYLKLVSKQVKFENHVNSCSKNLYRSSFKY